MLVGMIEVIEWREEGKERELIRLLSSSLLSPALTAAAACNELVILNLGLSLCPLKVELGLPMPELSLRRRLSPVMLFSWLVAIDMVRGNGTIPLSN